MKYNLKAVFVGVLAFGLASCGSEEAETTAPNGDVSESQDVEQNAEPSQGVKIEYSAARYENGVSYGDLHMGDPNAPITIIEYASLTCGHCASFHTSILPEIKRDYIETGKARLIYRNFLLNPYDLYASMISRCASPEKSFALMSLFFARQSVWINDDYLNKLAGLARRAGMSRATVDACVANAELQENLIEMQAYGSEEDGVTGTPTFLINGTRIVGADRDGIIAALEDAL
jgi:protein-disulfide isomerase